MIEISPNIKNNKKYKNHWDKIKNNSNKQLQIVLYNKKIKLLKLKRLSVILKS